MVPSYDQGFARYAGVSAFSNLRRGLVGAWLTSFGNSGDTLFDESGFHSDGALTGMDPATDWVNFEGKLALEFDGTTDQQVQVSVAGDLPLDFTQDKTFSLWFKADDTSTTQRMLANQVETTNVTRIWIQANEVGVTSYNGTFFSASTAFTDTTGWHHIVGIHDGTTPIGYLDGVLMASTTNRGGKGGGPSFNIGSDTVAVGSNPFNGLLADVFAWDRLLVPNEIQQLFVDPLAPFRLRRRVIPKSPVAVDITHVAATAIQPLGLVTLPPSVTAY